MDGKDNQLLERLRAYGADVDGTMGRMMDDVAFYQYCLENLLLDPGFDKLGEALKTGEFRHAFEEAHNLKGVTGNLGVTPLYQAVCQLVESLRHNENDGLEQKYQEILVQKERLKEIV